MGRPASPWATAILLLSMGGINLLQAVFPGRSFNWLQLITAVLLLGLGGWGMRRARRGHRLSQDANGPWVQEAKRRLESGDKIAAIKAVREATGLGLAEAKSVVESWER